jgi:hypothetical protein
MPPTRRAMMRRSNMKPEAETLRHPSFPARHGLRKRCLYRLSGEDWPPETATAAPERRNGPASRRGT